MNRKTKYRAEFCDALIKHLGKGLSFESFGAEVGCGRSTIYDWVDAHKEFAHAKEVGEARREAYMLNLGHMMVTGQLRRLASEEPVIGSDGRVVTDARGNPLTTKSYAHVKGDSAVFIFLLKNLCKYHDNKQVKHTGAEENEQPVRIEHSQPKMSDADVEKRYIELMKKERR